MLKPYCLGIDIGATKTVITLMDSQGEPLVNDLFQSGVLFRKAESAIDTLGTVIANLCEQAGIQSRDLKGIAVGFPGVMNHQTQMITSCPNLPELDGLFLGPKLTERLEAPVLVDKDTNLLALGELLKGCGKGIQDFACIYVGSGIGCGLVVNGELYRGADGAAGEFGHTVIEPRGKKCTCGGRGCLEMYCSGKALTLKAREIFRQSRKEMDLIRGAESESPSRWGNAEQVITAARAGHPVALKAVQIAFQYLGLGVTNLVNILNLRKVILGGGIVSGWPEGVSIVSTIVHDRARAAVKDCLTIEKAGLGQEASYIGAFSYLKTMLTNN